MSADSAVTYTSVHSEARSWSIPSEDPYEEAARQLLEQAPRSPEYVPEDHVPVYIPEPEHPEDLVPAEDEAPIPPLPPSFLAPRIRPPHTRAAMRQMRATAPSPLSIYLLHQGPLLRTLSLFLHQSTSRKVDIHEADTRLSEFRGLAQDIRCQKDVHCESCELRKALEARVTVLETEVRRHEWQRQAADDLVVQHIMRTQALEAGARVDTLEDPEEDPASILAGRDETIMIMSHLMMTTMMMMLRKRRRTGKRRST
ncbi:hypothetical protein Tco_0809723 [Tanacetum coccineum]